MFETPLTVVGHIVNDPQRRKVGDQELIKFRLASNSRRRTGDGTWEPGNSLFITVNCWGRLVTGVGAALGKGSPVIVVGHVYTSEYEDRDGNRRSSTGNAGDLGRPGPVARASCASRRPLTRSGAEIRTRSRALVIWAPPTETGAEDDQAPSSDATEGIEALPVSA